MNNVNKGDENKSEEEMIPVIEDLGKTVRHNKHHIPLNEVIFPLVMMGLCFLYFFVNGDAEKIIGTVLVTLWGLAVLIKLK